MPSHPNVPRTCTQCSAEFFVYPSRLKNNGARFCSKRCAGFAREYPSIEDRFWAKVDKVTDPDGCWVWVGAMNRVGYGAVGGNTPEELAHRLSWTFQNGPIPPGMKICHHCDNRPCVRPDHLFLGTQAENVADAAQKMRWKTKLTASAIREIRHRYFIDGIGQSDLGREYGVSNKYIHKVVHQVRFKHIV